MRNCQQGSRRTQAAENACGAATVCHRFSRFSTVIDGLGPFWRFQPFPNFFRESFVSMSLT
jgi:hypothetical protein